MTMEQLTKVLHCIAGNSNIVGFTIAEYDFFLALLEALIIAMVTFVICLCGLHIGKKVGVKLAGKANILGGVILIFIGLEIFVTGVFL